MKKVFEIIGRLNVGGATIHTILLTHHLSRSQYETRLIAGMEGPDEGSMRYMAEEYGFQPVYIPEMGREISLREDLIALFKLIAMMRRDRPDIVHTHTAKAGTLGRLAALMALPGRRKKVYHTFHGHVFHSYFSPRKTRFFILIERFLGRYTDRLIAVSERTRRELIEYQIAPEDKIVCIPLGLDLEPFAHCKRHRGELRRELGLPEDAILVGIVARLVPIKGLHDFLKAASCVAASVPDALFLVVGDGEQRQALEEYARALGLAERIRFLGYRQDLARIYADLDIVTLSSLNEGLPVSLIEAMSSGCVVVSTAVGGVPDLIQDKKTGFLVPPRNPTALAQALEHAIARQECWPAISAHAQELALSRFHIDRLVADIERLYAGEY